VRHLTWQNYTILWFLGFSLVGTCVWTKTECTQCDLGGTPAGCQDTSSVTSTENECFNGVDGVTNLMSKYRTDHSDCFYRQCLDPDIKYRHDRVVTFMTCSPGKL